MTVQEYQEIYEKQQKQQEKLILEKARIKNSDDYLALICFINFGRREYVVGTIYKEDWIDEHHVSNFRNAEYFKQIENAVSYYKQKKIDC